MSSTEITADDLWKSAKGPVGIIWNLGKFAYKGAKALNDNAKKREQEENAALKERELIEKYKFELQEIGLGDVNSVRNAWQQGKITLNEYMEIVNILKS